MKLVNSRLIGLMMIATFSVLFEKGVAQSEMSLSKMTAEDVTSYLVGKEWKTSDGRRFQFVTSKVMRMIEPSDIIKVWGYRVSSDKALRFRFMGKMDHTLHKAWLSEDLKSAKYERGGKKQPEWKLVGEWRPDGLRTGRLSAGTPEQFDRWLQSREMVAGDGSRRITFRNGIVYGLTEPLANKMTLKYQVVEPGLVEVNYSGLRFNQFYLTVSPDLEKFEYNWFRESISGMVKESDQSDAIASDVTALYSGPDEVTTLSRMSDAEFAAWLPGTNWEKVDEVDAAAFRFVSPNCFLFWNYDDRVFSAQYEVVEKGRIKVPWKGESDSKNHLVINEDLRSAIWHSGTRRIELRIVDRSVPAGLGTGKLATMSVEEFRKWLVSKSFSVSGASSINALQFFDGGDVRGFNAAEATYNIVVPGLVELTVADRRCPLLAVSPDLQSASLTTQWWNRNAEIKDAKGGSFTWTTTSGKQTTGEIEVDGLKEIEIKKNLTSVQALLLMPLGNSHYAAQTSKLSLTALALESDEAADLSFNQPVGEMMNSALAEVVRYHALRHGGWPRGLDIELSFADKYTGKDGPSAAVACALLLEAMFSGAELRSTVAVTGDMNADGSVQPVGGVRAKLRGASKGGAKIAIVPEKNKLDVLDLLVLEGPGFLTQMEVFGVSEFEEAAKIATGDSYGGIDYAIGREKFETFVNQHGVAGAKTSSGRQLLTEIAEFLPNHLSARLLLSYGAGSLPGYLSLSGSLDVVDQSVGEILSAAKSDVAATNSLDAGEVGQVASALQRLRSKLEPRARDYCDTWIQWAQTVDQLLSGRLPPSQGRPKLQAIAKQIDSEREALLTDSDVQEDLIR